MRERGEALIDRLALVNFGWTTTPRDVVKTLLVMLDDVYVQPLSPNSGSTELEEEAPIYNLKEKGAPRINDLFPLPEFHEKHLTSDYRYNVFIGRGKNRVHVSPHALMFLGYFIAGSRLNTDQQQAVDKLPLAKDIVLSPVFKQEIVRLSHLSGELELNSGEEAAIHKLSTLLNEGNFGVGARIVHEWFVQTVAEARKPENENSVTPLLLREVLHKKLDNGSLRFSDVDGGRLYLLGLADDIMYNLIIPKIKEDIFTSMVASEDLVKNTYYEFLQEAIALNKSPEAKTYLHPTYGKDYPINQGRFSKISEAYQKLHQRPFNVQLVGMLFAAANVTPGANKAENINKDLYKAIASLHANQAIDAVDILTLARYGQDGSGDSNIKNKYEAFVRALEKMGYCSSCVRAALQLAAKEDSFKRLPPAKK